MAKQIELTERQQQIKDKLDKGQTPEQIGKSLKITTNAVYQQVRRLRAAGVEVSLGNGSGSTAKRTTRKASGSTGRKSPRTRQAAAPKPQTAEEILTAEVAATQGEIDAQTARITEAEAVVTDARTQIEALTVELARRQDTLAVLTGEKVAHAKPTQKPAAEKPADAPKPRNGQKRSGGTSAAKATPTPAQATNGAQAAQEAPQATSATAVPEPSSQAEREATADFDPERAEADAAQAAAEEPVAS